MKTTIRGLTGILAGCIFCMFCSVAVFAAKGAVILETYTGENSVSVYVKGANKYADDINVQIATAEAEKVEKASVSKLDTPMKTLIMIDNSISIPAGDRKKISALVENMIAGLKNEEISIATFSEDINIVTDYTSDYKTLKQAADSIKYHDQETYLTDVLYDLISTHYVNQEEDTYRRIIVISDGVDNKSLGYTKEELSNLLRDCPVPIYTIGCSTENNNEQLENMFAISRQTNVKYFLLDKVKNMFDISDVLGKDLKILRLTITPPADMMDGAKKAVKITLSDGESLTVDIAMPQQLQIEEPEPEPEPEPETESRESEPETEAVEPETEAVQETESADSGIGMITVLLIGTGAAAVIAVICIVIIVGKKKRSNRASFEIADSSILNERQNDAADAGERTLLLDPGQNGDADHDGTVMIWNQGTTYQVVLTDINSPAKSFRAPLNQAIVIGRKADKCDIALDYEKSVSAKHCEISVSGGKFYVTDLQSSNGTFLNGSKVLTKTEIFSGNTLRLGKLEMRFEVR